MAAIRCMSADGVTNPGTMGQEQAPEDERARLAAYAAELSGT